MSGDLRGTYFDVSSLKLKIANLEKYAPDLLKKTMQQTTAQGLHLIKTQYPKGRSGEARKSFLSEKINDFTYKIFSKLIQVQVLEYGSPAHTILPKRKDFLSIPINKMVLVPNGYRFKKMSKNQYWAAVKYGWIKRVKKAEIPAFEARKPLNNIFLPAIAKRLVKNINKVYKEFLNG